MGFASRIRSFSIGHFRWQAIRLWGVVGFVKQKVRAEVRRFRSARIRGGTFVNEVKREASVRAEPSPTEIFPYLRRLPLDIDSLRERALPPNE
jgi:hypothetical protein